MIDEFYNYTAHALDDYAREGIWVERLRDTSSLDRAFCTDAGVTTDKQGSRCLYEVFASEAQRRTIPLPDVKKVYAYWKWGAIHFHEYVVSSLHQALADPKTKFMPERMADQREWMVSLADAQDAAWYQAVHDRTH